MQAHHEHVRALDLTRGGRRGARRRSNTYGYRGEEEEGVNGVLASHGEVVDVGDVDDVGEDDWHAWRGRGGQGEHQQRGRALRCVRGGGGAADLVALSSPGGGEEEEEP